MFLSPGESSLTFLTRARSWHAISREYADRNETQLARNNKRKLRKLNDIKVSITIQPTFLSETKSRGKNRLSRFVPFAMQIRSFAVIKRVNEFSSI